MPKAFVGCCCRALTSARLPYRPQDKSFPAHANSIQRQRAVGHSVSGLRLCSGSQPTPIGTQSGIRHGRPGPLARWHASLFQKALAALETAKPMCERGKPGKPAGRRLGEESATS